MAKVITPPAITDLSGLLELLARPERGVEYLKQLQDMRDAIFEGLGVVKTKNAADALLGQATATLTAAKEQATAMTEASVKHRQSVEQDMAQMQQETRAAKAQVYGQLKRVEERERAIQFSLKSIEEREAAHAARAQELAGQQILLDARAAHLDQEEAKLKQLKALMASHGI